MRRPTTRTIILTVTLSASVLLGACAIPPAPAVVATPCVIAPENVLSWAKFGTLEERPLPYAEAYSGCGKTLVYVAAEHGNDPGSETYRLVSQSFADARPDFVVLEGFPFEMGISPEALRDYAAEVAGTPGDAEPYFAVRLAQAAGVAFVGGEPTDAAVVAAATRAGMSAADVFGYYIVRLIPQWMRSETLSAADDERLDTEIRSYAAQFAEDADIDISALADVDTIDTFKAWYSAKNGLDFQTGYRPEDAWPSGALPDPRVTNRLADIVSDAREQHIVSVIAGAVEKHNTVLVVYGGSHHLVQAPAFEKAF
ncbi:MAG: hypothetical protein R3B98_04275 [Hyphomonas sp.]